jgi:molecular chaperone GrpE
MIMQESKDNVVTEEKKENKHHKEIDVVKAENEILKEKNKELEDRHLRDLAELQNYKRRKDEEVAKIVSFSNEVLIQELLPTIDNFERAIEANKNNQDASNINKGIEMIYTSLLGILNQFGLKEIEALNKPFDPNYHQAISTDNIEDKEDNIILEVLQKGYLLKDKVIRPVMVKVNKKESKGEDKNE